MRLAHLQKWMQAVVVHPGSTRQALHSKEASRFLKAKEIDTVLLPSPTLSPAERIGVYQEMFPLRMHDALAADYPALEHFLGHHFQEFVVAYTEAHPSRGYTLNRLGDNVPAFLAKQRRFTPRPFLVDLARLELALTEAFDEHESPTLKAEDFEAISKRHLEKTKLATIPSLRLVALQWNVDAYLDSVRDEKHDHPGPRKEPAFLLVFRRNYGIYRLKVPPGASALLEDVVAGRPLGDAVERALARRGRQRVAAGDFSRWFRQWTSEGLFSGVRRVRG